MPTLLGLTGLAVPHSVDGIDYSQIITGESRPRPKSAFIAAYPYPGRFDAREIIDDSSEKHKYDIRVGRCGIDWRTWGYRGVRTQRYTYVVDRYVLYRYNTLKDYAGRDWTPEEMADRLRNGEHERRLLYDNELDPYQLNPLETEAVGCHEAAKDLENELQSWLGIMNDPFPI